MSKHRAAGPAFTRLHRHSFKPSHCAGDTCFHEHVVETRPGKPLGLLSSIRTPLTSKRGAA